MNGRRVVLVDDHELIRQGLARAFERTGDFAVVGQARSVAEAQQVVPAARPDVVVTDVGLPDGSGLDLARSLRGTFPDLGIVVLTMHSGDNHLFAAMDAGASAFIGKDAPASDVIAASRNAVVSPSTFASPTLAEALRRRLSSTTPRLSEREQQVLVFMADGYGVAEIASRLYISTSTAKTHIAKIYDKLGAANRSQALVTAMRMGLLGVEDA